jgi:hypothetical protein
MEQKNASRRTRAENKTDKETGAGKKRSSRKRKRRGLRAAG